MYGNYLPYNNSTNANMNDWRKIQKAELVLNKKNLFELKFNITDTVFLGT